MIITCKECSTSYNLDEGRLKPSGSKVRCSRCGSIFTAFPPHAAQAAVEPAEDFSQAESATGIDRIQFTGDGPRSSYALESIFDGTDDQADVFAESAQPVEKATTATKLTTALKSQEEFEAIDPDLLSELKEDDLEPLGKAPIGLEEDEINMPGAKTPKADATAVDDLDFGAEDFDIANLEEDSSAKDAPSAEDLHLTPEDLDLVMDFKPGATKPEIKAAATPETETAPAASAPSLPAEKPIEEEINIDLDFDVDSNEPVKLEAEDLDLGFSLQSGKSKNTNATETAADEIAPDLDLDANPPAPGAPAKDAFDDLDLNLDFEAEDTTEASPAETSEELSLDLGEEPLKNSAAGSSDDLDLGLELTENEKEETTLDDTDLGLDLTAEAGKPEEPDELDLALTLDEEPVAAKNQPASDKTDLDLGLQLKEKDENTDGLDDLDLDFSLADDSNQKTQPADLDFNLDFDEAPVAASAKSDSAELDIEPELNLDLDGKVETAKNVEDSDDFDLSDLEQMLGSNGKPMTKGPGLKVKRHEDKEKTEASESQKASGMNLDPGAGEFDISEIEQILDDDEDDKKKNAQSKSDDDLELELDLGEEFAQSAKTVDSKKESPAGIDLSEFEYLAEQGEKSPADEHFDTGDMELEFQIDDHQPAAASTIPAAAESTAAAASVAEPEEAELIDEEFITHPEAPAMPEKKRSISKVLVLALIVVILLGGGYCTYILLDGMGIRIPVISDYLNPKADDPGSANIIANIDINTKFVDNATGGRLFVVTGKAMNNYPQARAFIQMTGKLFTQGKKLAKTETVYCGNIIPDADLTNADVAQLKKQLSDRFGDKKDSMKVDPGQTLPFMVIFSDLPKEQLEEFTIAVDKSIALGK
jgi:predicted Zn finger-like uncharacterized protein